MSAAVSAPSSKTPAAPFAQSLRALRARLLRWFWLDGLAVVAWTVLSVALVDFALDRWLKLDRAQRAIMLFLAIATLGIVAWRRLVRPLMARLTDDALCLEVERRHRELGQKLISALQLSRDGDWAARGVSPQLAEAVIAAGSEAAKSADWSDVLDRTRERRNACLLSGALVVVLAVAASSWISPLPGIWWRRNVGLSNERWPQATYLSIDGLVDGRVRVPRGESYTVRVTVDPNSRQLPDRVQLEFRPARGRSAVSMNSVEPTRFEHQLQRVIENFSVRAVGGDAETDWTPVEIVEPPALSDLQLEVTPPAYTKLPTITLAAGAGPHAVLEGSRCRLTANANKPLQSARMVHERGEWNGQLATPKSVAWELSEEHVHAGRYSIYLEDAEGIRPQQPLSFVLQIQPDRAPRVEAKLVGVSGSVLANARIPLAIHVRDDFAVTDVRVLWQSRAEGDEAASEASPVALPEFASQAGQPDVTFRDTFDLGPLKLAPGRTLTFVVEATDNDTRDGPNRGRSNEFLLKIVTAEELRADWLRREKEQRQELEQLLRTQEDLITDTEALATQSELNSADRVAVAALARRQKQVAQQLEGVAQRLDTIAAEVVNNRLDAEPDRLAERLRRELVAPLNKVASEPAAESQQHLEQARRAMDDAEARQAGLKAGVAAEQQTAAQLKGILERMLKAEGFQEAVQLLYEIQKAQQDVLDRTQREKQQRIEAILRGSQKKE